jgi:mannose-6-phosphate isomerase-like protein (cupin superfamily)
MIFAEEKLQLRRDGHSLGIAKERWVQALCDATPDDIVRIRHAEIEGDPSRRIHVAAIPDSVGCHFHAYGDEDYSIVSGRGELYWGAATRNAAGYSVAWEEPMPIKEGDSFIIPEGYVHQLKNVGKNELIILFACPDSHLDDKLDRFMIPSLFQ